MNLAIQGHVSQAVLHVRIVCTRLAGALCCMFLFFKMRVSVCSKTRSCQLITSTARKSKYLDVTAFSRLWLCVRCQELQLAVPIFSGQEAASDLVAEEIQVNDVHQPKPSPIEAEPTHNGVTVHSMYTANVSQKNTEQVCHGMQRCVDPLHAPATCNL